jgi:hypothetical protein
MALEAVLIDLHHMHFLKEEDTGLAMIFRAELVHSINQ